MSPAKLPDEMYASLLAEADVYTRGKISADGRFFANELSIHLAAGFGRNGQADLGNSVLSRLLADLKAVHFSTKEGYGRRGLSRHRPVTLEDLVSLARQNVDINRAQTRGRRASRDVDGLSTAQLVSITTAAGVVAEMVTGDRFNLAGVRGQHFAWVPTAGEGAQGDWALVKQIGDYSDLTASAKFERTNRRDGANWHAGMNASRRKAHASGVRILLDLAATKGLITRGEDHDAFRNATRRAAEWHSICEAWVARLVSDIGKNRRDIDRGIKTLALYATRQGALSPIDTDWGVVRDTVEADFRRPKDPITNNVRTWAAYAYRALRERGMVLGPEWPTATSKRVSLVQTGLSKASASTGDYSTWVTDSGDHPASLCGTLAEWHRWSTLPADLLDQEHRHGNLPIRAWPRPSVEQQLRAARNDSLFRLSPATLQGRVASFNLVAGYAARHRGIDFTHDPDCDTALVDPETLEHFLRQRHPGQGDAKDQLLAAAGWHLATLASPFLEARALLHRDRALAAGDRVLAERLMQKADLLRAHAIRLQVVAARATPTKRSRTGEGEELTRKAIQRIWQLWTEDGVSGWHKLGRMRDAMIIDIERIGSRSTDEASTRGAQSLSLQDQITAIRAKRFRATKTWAVLVRDAVVITLLWKIPLRARNIIEMTFDNLKQLDGGAIQVEFSADEMKSDRAFEPPLITSSDLKDPDAVRMVRPDLWELYLMVGGARDEVLRLTRDIDVWVREPDTAMEPDNRRTSLWHQPSPWVLVDPADDAVPGPAERRRRLGAGDICPSRYVFPALARVGGHNTAIEDRVRREAAYDGGGFTNQIKKRFCDYADVMKIDIRKLSCLFGALAPHIARLLFGSHHCDPERWPDAIGEEAASKLLHHASIDFTRSKYVAKNEREVSAVSRQQTQNSPTAAENGTCYADEMRHAAEARSQELYTEEEYSAVKQSIREKYRQRATTETAPVAVAALEASAA